MTSPETTQQLRMTCYAPFQIDDKVQFSELGRDRNPLIGFNQGTIVGCLKGRKVYLVLLDGNKWPTQIHETYLERTEINAALPNPHSSEN
jgi:hypothetical protein